MSVENIDKIGIECGHLETMNVPILDNSVVIDFETITTAEEMVEGLTGTCLTGQRGECPLGLNCTEVKVSVSIPPLFIQIEPIEVKS